MSCLRSSPKLIHPLTGGTQVGAGYAGIIAAIRIDQRLRNVDLDVYEKVSTESPAIEITSC